MSSPAAVAVEPIGDAAVAVRIEGRALVETVRRVRAVAAAVRSAGIRGVTDVVASPGRVTVAYDPLVVDGVETVQSLVAGAVASVQESAAAEPVIHELPVAYDGPDLANVCLRHGLDQAAFVAAHTAPEYLVEAIGFLPGFGYLAGLPTTLATPRLATPRRLVPAGAVGIGGGQTGAYPFASPGGWNLVGRTNVRLFEAARSRPALLEVGDRVRFSAADLPPAEHPVPSLSPPAFKHGITVVEPGLSTTIQDLGRPGYRDAGVPLSGAADRVSLRLANLLVGNPEDAAALECTLLGPTLRFDRESLVAIVGADFPGFPGDAATFVPANAVLTLGHATRGCRGYLAVAGGIDVAQVLGSYSTLAVAGFGGFAGRALRAGDKLAVGARRAEAARRLTATPCPSGPQVLRVIAGEQAEAFGAGAWRRTFRTSSRSDRMGLRLEGEPLVGAAAFGSMASVAVFPGTVQVPPDGQPILLLADAQTIGGYPVVGQVIAADLPLAAQLRPGDEIRLKPVTLAQAHAAFRQQEAAIAAFREAVR